MINYKSLIDGPLKSAKEILSTLAVDLDVDLELLNKHIDIIDTITNVEEFFVEGFADDVLV